MKLRSVVGILFSIQCASVASTAMAATPAECVAASEASLKLRDQRKLRDARAQSLICSSAGCPDVIQADCLRRVDELNQAIPTIVFQAKDAAGADVADVKVTVDGQPLAERLDGTELTVDPGEHHFAFTAAGTTVEKVIIVNQGEKNRRELVVVGPQPVATPAAVALATTVPPAKADDGSSRRLLGIGIGAVGLASIAVGAVTGALASSKASSSKNECSTPTQCPNHDQSVSDYNAASTDATISTVTFIAGGAAVAAGAILFFTAPRVKTAGVEWQLAPAVGFGTAGLTVRGSL
jgi:hypothetical protein